MLILGLLDLVEIVEEKFGIFSSIVCSSEDIPGDTSCAAILNIFVTKEDIHVAVFESNRLIEALLLRKIVLLTIVHTVIAADQCSCRSLHELRHLLLPHEFIVRVKIDLYVPLRVSLLLQEKGLLEELREGDEGRWPRGTKSAPLHGFTLTISAQSVV